MLDFNSINFLSPKTNLKKGKRSLNRKILIAIPTLAIVILSAFILTREPPKPEFHVLDFEIERDPSPPYNATVSFMIQNLGVGKASSIEIVLELNISTVNCEWFGGKKEDFEEWFIYGGIEKFIVRFILVNLTLTYTSLESKEIRKLEIEFNPINEALNVEEIWGMGIGGRGEPSYKINEGKVFVSCKEGVKETLTI